MKNITDFLSNLLNTPLSESETIILTSAQRARFLSWSDQNGFKIDVRKLQAQFSISDLLTNGVNQTAHELNRNPEKQQLSVNLKSSSRIGIDIQSISEMFPAPIELDYPQLSSIYTSYELKFSKNSADPRATLVGLFSLKECLIKAGAPHLDYLDLEITHTAQGSPIFYGYEVSLSHSGDFVTSIAIKI